MLRFAQGGGVRPFNWPSSKFFSIKAQSDGVSPAPPDSKAPANFKYCAGCAFPISKFSDLSAIITLLKIQIGILGSGLFMTLVQRVTICIQVVGAQTCETYLE